MPLEKIYSLFNEPEMVRIDRLTEEQALVVLKGLSKSAIKEWDVWHVGLKNWLPAGMFLDSYDKEKSQVPLGLSVPDSSHSESSDINKSGLSLKEEAQVWQVQRRKHSRYQSRMILEVELEGKIWQTTTVNVSLGGIKLEETLPFPNNTPVNLVLKHGNSKLHLRCQVINDQANPEDRTRLMIQSCEHLELLRHWIVKNTTWESK
jgi:hypothetical protein